VGEIESKRRRSKSARLSKEALELEDPMVAAQARQPSGWLAGWLAAKVMPQGLRQDRRELQNVSLGMHRLHFSRCMALLWLSLRPLLSEKPIIYCVPASQLNDLLFCEAVGRC
jgi:hypothetical protein